MTKAKQTERTEAIERLREWLKPGDTVYTILRHVSRSGLSRTIDCVGVEPSTEPSIDARGVRVWAYGWAVAKALGYRFDRDLEGVKVGGCGMDMGFHLVYSLSATLFPNGFGCVGAGCPSSDHSNGDRDYTPHHDCSKCMDGDAHVVHDGAGDAGKGHWHFDGGHALRQRWL